MTIDQAYRILGLPQNANQKELKKRYRQLLHQIHPDSRESFGPGTGIIHLAVSDEIRLKQTQQINLAYSLLKKRIPLVVEGKAKRRAASSASNGSDLRESAVFWGAPVNPYAFCAREIFHYAEDSEGQILGSFTVASGKYLWEPEEDFPLFLLSLYRCGSRLLDEIDGACQNRQSLEIRQRVQPELTYLLAQQFLDCSSLLAVLAEQEGEEEDKMPIYSLKAMLELNQAEKKDGCSLTEGEFLAPSSLRNHRLYLKNGRGKELGYLSFCDDRLYYIVVPLFEQKRIRVRIQVVGSGAGKGRRERSARKNYFDLKLWMKLQNQDVAGLPENLSQKIGQMLDAYRKACAKLRKECSNDV